MTASFGAVVLSTPDPRELAGFYAAGRGGRGGPAAPAGGPRRHPDRERPGLSFQRELGDTPPTWPAHDGGVPMQAHLDLLVDDLDAEQARAVALGARLEAHQPTPGVRVMRDPHGHVFCLFLPGS